MVPTLMVIILHRPGPNLGGPPSGLGPNFSRLLNGSPPNGPGPSLNGPNFEVPPLREPGPKRPPKKRQKLPLPTAILKWR